MGDDFVAWLEGRDGCAGWRGVSGVDVNAKLGVCLLPSLGTFDCISFGLIE